MARKRWMRGAVVSAVRRRANHVADALQTTSAACGSTMLNSAAGVMLLT
jgi:hypothetical protein